VVAGPDHRREDGDGREREGGGKDVVQFEHMGDGGGRAVTDPQDPRNPS
jgi:hypothetical protein